MATPSWAPSKPLFESNLLSKATHKNYFLLKHVFDHDIEKALLAQQDLPLGYGPEFKPITTLERVFVRRPVWEQMKSVLACGLKWPLEPLKELE
jgi:hypothetical protein